MDLAALRAETKARGFDYVTDARIDNWINVEYRELCSRYMWPFLETATTIPGTGTITDVRFVQSVVHVAQARVLQWIDRRALLETVSDLSTTGAPSYWYFENDTLKTYPATTETLAVRYVKVPARLASGSDTPIVPEEFHDILVDGAVARGYKDTENWTAFNGLKPEYERQVAAMATAEMRRAAPDRVQSVRGHEGF